MCRTLRQKDGSVQNRTGHVPYPVDQAGGLPILRRAALARISLSRGDHAYDIVYL